MGVGTHWHMGGWWVGKAKCIILEVKCMILEVKCMILEVKCIIQRIIYEVDEQSPSPA